MIPLHGICSQCRHVQNVYTWKKEIVEQCTDCDWRSAINVLVKCTQFKRTEKRGITITIITIRIKITTKYGDLPNEVRTGSSQTVCQMPDEEVYQMPEG